MLWDQGGRVGGGGGIFICALGAALTNLAKETGA